LEVFRPQILAKPFFSHASWEFCQDFAAVFEPPWPDLGSVQLFLLPAKESVAGVLDREPGAGYLPWCAASV
jgi:hypothetical protein